MTLSNIQALRALAVVAVVLGHLQPLAQQAHPALAWVGLGRSGVDLFFVISGFIMVYTTEREAPSAAQFALRRLIRIAPLYWIVTLAVFAIALAAPGVLGASRPDPTWLLKSLAFIPFDKGDGTTNPLVPVGWTLNYEMFFYGCFALALLIPRRRIAYGIAAAVIGGLGLVGFQYSFENVLLNFYTRPILIEFALGIALGVAFQRLPALRGAGPVAVGTAALWGLVAALAASGLATAEGLRVVIAGAASAGIVALALMLEAGGSAVRNPLVLRIGDASYAIYLTHLFVTQAFVVGARGAGVSDPIGSGLLVLAALVAVVAAGFVTYRHLERPAGNLLKRRLPVRRRPEPARSGDAPPVSRSAPL